MCLSIAWAVNEANRLNWFARPEGATEISLTSSNPAQYCSYTDQGKSQISLSLDVITYTWVDSSHTSLCMKRECQTFVWSFDSLKTYNESTKDNLSYLEVWEMFCSDTISEPNRVKIGHTARESRVLGSKSNFSPGVSLWFSTWSSLSWWSCSKPSTTAILFPPRYLQSSENNIHVQTHTSHFIYLSPISWTLLTV